VSVLKKLITILLPLPFLPVSISTSKKAIAGKVSSILPPSFASQSTIFWAKNFPASTAGHSSSGTFCKDELEWV
jgi:hypothetical protein